MAALAGLCFAKKSKEPFQSINGRLLDAVQAGILDLSAVELFGAEAQQDPQGAATALQSFWQEVVKSKKTGLSLVGLETFDLCSAALLEPNSISKSVLWEQDPRHAEFFTKAIFDRVQAQGTSPTKKVLYESLAMWVDMALGKTKKTKDLKLKASLMIQEQGMDVGPPQENIQANEGEYPPEPKTSAEDWLQQLMSLKPKPLVLRGALADWQLLPVLLKASSPTSARQAPSDNFSFKELLVTLAGTLGRSFSPLTQAVLTAVSDASIRLGKLGRSPPSKLSTGMLRQFSEEVVKGALDNLKAAKLRLFGAGAVVLKAIAIFLDQADREPRVEDSDSDDSGSESARPPKPLPTVLSNLEGHAWNIVLAMIFCGTAAPKLRGQVHPGYLSSVLKPAFGAIAGEVPLSTGLTKEQEDVVCSSGKGFVETARAWLRQLASRADDSEVLRFMHTGFVRRQGARDFAQLGFEPPPPSRSRANTEIEVRTEPTPSPKPRMSIRHNPEEEARLRAIFDQCDTNGDGTLNKRELIKMCRASADTAEFFGLPANIRQEDGTRDLLEAKFQKMDQNSDREVNWEEFCEWYECEVLLEQERASQVGEAEASPKMNSDVPVNVKKSLVGEDDTDSEDELPPPPAHTGFASIQALTSMTSDGRLLVEDVEDFEEVQPFKIQEDDRMQAEKFLEFIFDQVQSQREDEQGITRKDFEAALAASWATYGDCFEQSDDVSEDLAEQPVGPLEFVDHFLSLDPAEALHGLRLLQPPPEPWPDICLPKVQHSRRDGLEMVKEDTAVAALVETMAAPAIEDTVESMTEEMLPEDDLPLDSVDPMAPIDPKAPTETSAFAMAESLPPAVTPQRVIEVADPIEPTVPVTELPRTEPIEAQATAVQSVIITEATDSEDDEPADKTWFQRPEEPVEQDDEPPRILKEVGQAEPSDVVHAENMALEDEVIPMHNEEDKAEPAALQIIEVRDDSREMKYSPPENWFSDDVIPAVPPPPVLPEVVQQQDPSGGLPLIPSARGNPPERQAWGSESASAQKALELPSMLSTTANTSQEESQRLALPCSDTVLPTLTFSQDDVAVQRPSEDQEAIVALPFDASPVQDVGSAAPESARTEALSLLTPRTDLEVTGGSEATSHGPAETRLATVAPVAESQELVPAPQERRRSSFAGIREQLQTETHPLSQPRSLEPAKPQVNFAPHRLSQICLRNGEADEPSGKDGGAGSTIHDDFRQLPRKLQAQVASLYQELEDAKDSKRRAEQENTEIMNYLSAILSDDRPEQFALMDGPLTSLPPGPLEEDEKELLLDDTADTKDKMEVAQQQLEPPPPLPFPSEHLQASPQAPPAPPDFLNKPLVNINFGGGPPEGWGSSREPRRSDQVLQDSLASVLPMAFRQLFERPQSWAEQQEQYVRERQQLQEGLHLMQQQLQQLQQQISQGKSVETPQPSQRSLLEQLRAELAAERRQMHDQQRQQIQQDQRQQFQQQQVQQLLEQQVHQLQLQVQQQAQQQQGQQAQQAAEQQSVPTELQKMLAELRTNGEATIGELRAALEELRQSKDRLERQAAMPPLPFSFEQETCSRPRSPTGGVLNALWEEPSSQPPTLLRSAKVPFASQACPHCGQMYLPHALFCRSCQMKRNLPEVLDRLPHAHRRRSQPAQPLQVSRSLVFDKELARWDSRAEQLEARFRRINGHARR